MLLKKGYSTEKILLIVALFLFACILFFNAFYRPEAAIPSVIYVSKEEEKTQEEADKQNIQGSKININTATEDELSEGLSGIGSAIAKRIIEYREQSGGFSDIEDIKNVSGIGEKMFEKIKNDICV